MTENRNRNIIFKLGIPILILLCAGIIFKLFIYSYPPVIEEQEANESGINYQKNHNNYIIYTPFVPKELEFCGEYLPLERFDVFQALDYEFLKITFWQSETILYLKRQRGIFSIVEPILKKNNIPDDFKYLLVTESGMTNAVSPAHAAGYWQFLKQTAIEYGLEVNKEVDERYNLEKSTQAACRYLRDSYKILKNWTLVAASYNAGRARIIKELKRQKVSSFYDLLLVSETSRYIYRIVVYKQIMQHPRKYGFELRTSDAYQLPVCDVIKVDSSIDDLITFANSYNTTYKILKKLNPWLRSDKLTNSNKKNYYVKVPKQK